MFVKLPDSQNILLVGAAGNALINKCIKTIKAQAPNTKLCALVPKNSNPEEFDIKPSLFFSSAAHISQEDIARADINPDTVILNISHVTRMSYKPLVRACVQKARNILLFSANGLQPLDMSDTLESIPNITIATHQESPEPDTDTWIFFRPSDQSVHAKARELEAEGKKVFRVDSLAALKELAQSSGGVFFDWCLTDYTILARAFMIAAEHNLYISVFFALDLADIAEMDATKKGLMTINSALLPNVNKCYYLKTRPYLIERYKLNPEICIPISNIPNPDIWNMDKAQPKDNSVLTIAYHGLFYSWHEVAAFTPVIEELKKLIDVRIDLYGRIHESVSFSASPLSPVTEKKTRKDIEKLCQLPEVTMHGFTQPEKTAQAIGAAHFYLGITQSACLMSKTEMRTGVIEALAVGTPVLHKATQATKDCQMVPDKDFINTDSLQPKAAAQKIMNAFNALYRSNQ